MKQPANVVGEVGAADEAAVAARAPAEGEAHGPAEGQAHGPAAARGQVRDHHRPREDLAPEEPGPTLGKTDQAPARAALAPARFQARGAASWDPTADSAALARVLANRREAAR